MWLRQFLAEIDFHPSSPTVIFEHDKSTINIVHNGNENGRTKYMNIRYHNVLELVQNQHLSVSYRPTSSMTADVLAKPLDSKLFLSHRSSLLGAYIYLYFINININ